MHEPVHSNRKVVVGSDRNFGLVFTFVFLFIGLVRTVLHAEPPRWWALGLALAFCSTALLVPHLLQPLNRIWFRFGLVLHEVINPFVMGIVFYLAVVPTGLLARAFGSDLLRLKRDPRAQSYWIMREASAARQGSMTKQF